MSLIGIGVDEGDEQVCPKQAVLVSTLNPGFARNELTNSAS